VAGWPAGVRRRWPLSRVADLIRREFTVNYHPNYLQRVLALLGFSPQKSLPRAVEQDEALVRAWLPQDWPRIKKARRHAAPDRVFR
jgi:transposase